MNWCGLSGERYQGQVWLLVTTMAETTITQNDGQHTQQGDFNKEEETENATSQELIEPEEEQASETLYIQNLNDKVKLSCRFRRLVTFSP
jgi:hypothetical protein